MAQSATQKQLPHRPDDIEDAEIIEGSVDDEFERMQADFDAGDVNEYRVRIYRIMEGKGELRYLFGALPSDFPILDKVRDGYGSGRYEVRLLRKHKIAKRWTQEIEAPANWEPPKPESEKTEVRESTAQIVGAINQAFETFAKVHMPAQPVESAPAIDPIALQNNILQSMAQMKALFAPEHPPTPPSDQGRLMFEAFTKGIEIMKDMNGAGETGVWDVVKAAAEPDGLLSKLTELAQATDARLTQPQRIVDASGRPIPQAGGTVSNDQKTQMFIQQQLATLVARAKAGSDPALYAELILDTVQPDVVAQFIAAPDAIEKLKAVNPEVANHEDWFRAVGVHLNDMLAEAAPDGETETGTVPDGESVAPSAATDSEITGDTERPGGDTGNP